MYCRNCGSEMDEGAAICVNCGFQKGKGGNYCSHCGQPMEPNQMYCMSCGFKMGPVSSNGGAVSYEKNRLVAVFFAFFLGYLGIHKFYLGYTKQGVIMLLVSVLTFGIGLFVMAVIALVEFGIYLSKSDEDFDRIYVQGKRGWF